VERREIPCVAGIVVDDAGRILLVRRGQEPGKGCWSVPGGRVEPGEDDTTATAREVLEETGLAVEVTGLAGTVERDAPDGSVYLVRDYTCVPADAVAADRVLAGDDADEVGWFAPEEVDGLECVPGLLEALRDWGAWPRPPG
jgi:8-oxo-dGTP diphosphatase